MNKTVVLLSVPHSGTHTWMEAMFRANINAAWTHLEPGNRELIEKILALPKEEILFCITHRDYRLHKKSFLARATHNKRMTEVRAEVWFEECLDLRDWFVEQTLDRPVSTLETNGSYYQRRAAMSYLLSRLGRGYEEGSPLDHFMSHWPAYNVFTEDSGKKNLATTYPLIDRRVDQITLEELRNGPSFR